MWMAQHWGGRVPDELSPPEDGPPCSEPGPARGSCPPCRSSPDFPCPAPGTLSSARHPAPALGTRHSARGTRHAARNMGTPAPISVSHTGHRARARARARARRADVTKGPWVTNTGDIARPPHQRPVGDARSRLMAHRRPPQPSQHRLAPSPLTAPFRPRRPLTAQVRRARG